MILILVLLNIAYSSHIKFLSEEHWLDFSWTPDSVLERIDEKFEEDYKRAYIEFKAKDHFSPARKETVMTRFEILEEIRARNRYAFLDPFSKYILTTDKVKYVPEELVYGDPEKEEREYWEKVAKEHKEVNEIDKHVFDVKDFQSPIDFEEKDEIQYSATLDLETQKYVGFDNHLVKPSNVNLEELDEYESKIGL